ncbi:ABC transporter substrate-binding protein [Paenibacillus sp. 598K]|uniref:ABC transporter substrate-binding protein n=1 Tax=Paenibacillus sp. 598K TaxID=1117987 RepID=UPI000FF9CAE5|nr:extracellular solute-binding protein [Paenibacillus sp. 598K]GBF77919.1 ABC transporter substrate-binding protein [Paenibacillus sp. 598K]
MNKKLKLATVLSTVLLMLITACSSEDSSSEAGTKDKVTENGKTILTLSMLQSTPFYEALEKKFEARYPDIDLRIQAQKEPGAEYVFGEEEEYQRSINTALLSGTGPDVFSLEGMSVNDYVEKELILNMDRLLEQEETLQQDQLHANVLEAMKQNGGTYTLPSGFNLRAFIGNGEALKDANIDEESWTWQDFADVAKRLTQGDSGLYAMADYTPDMLMQEMIIDGYSSYVDEGSKTVRFDSPEFIALLKQVQQLYEDGVMTTEAAEPGKQLFYSTVLYGPADVINQTHIRFDQPQLMQKPHSQAQSGHMRILPTAQFAIRADTAVQEEAWKLLSFLLSEEMQQMPEREGFSMLKSVNDQKLDEVKKQVQAGSYKLSNGQVAQAEDEEFTRFAQLLDLADRYSMLNARLISIVGEESLAYFSGQMSAEEAAQLLQNRATILLNE